MNVHIHTITQLCAVILKQTHLFTYLYGHWHIEDKKTDYVVFFFTASWNPLVQKPAGTKLKFYTLSCFKYIQNKQIVGHQVPA